MSVSEPCTCQCDPLAPGPMPWWQQPATSWAVAMCTSDPCRGMGAQEPSWHLCEDHTRTEVLCLGAKKAAPRNGNPLCPCSGARSCQERCSHISSFLDTPTCKQQKVGRISLVTDGTSHPGFSLAWLVRVSEHHWGATGEGGQSQHMPGLQGTVFFSNQSRQMTALTLKIYISGP